MSRQVLQILLPFLILICFTRCAQVGVLTGGPRDTTPPQLKEALPPNQSTGFHSGEILLSFDEFVQVNDVANQLIVSPKLKENPSVVAEGKKVRITFDAAQLQPNTTYRFYLGQCIADINEGNMLRNFEYVFSTGSYIDSLKLNGQVTDAFTNSAADNVLVALYHNSPNDSLPYNEPPDYISRTDKEGRFAFSHLPHASLRVYAIADKNKNNLYDGETEKIAFRDTLLVLEKDSSVNLRLFREAVPKFFVKKVMNPYYGLTTILLSKKMKTVVKPLKTANGKNMYESSPGVEKDTINVFYHTLKDSLALLVQSPNQTDTLYIMLPKRPTTTKKFATIQLNSQNGVLAYNTAPQLIFTQWMDTSRTQLRATFRERTDTVHAPETLSGYWSSATRFTITNPTAPGKDYEIKADTNVFFDKQGVASDSLKMSFRTQSLAELGKVTLKLVFEKKGNYLVQLIDDKENPIAMQPLSLSLSSTNIRSLVFEQLLPATYRVKVIRDENNNGMWDSGDLIKKKQPERVNIHPKPIKVLADWEIEEEIPVKN